MHAVLLVVSDINHKEVAVLDGATALRLISVANPRDEDEPADSHKNIDEAYSPTEWIQHRKTSRYNSGCIDTPLWNLQ